MSTWKIKSSLEEWESVSASIEDELHSLAFSNKFIISLMIAMDEIIANITSYAYPDKTGNVIIESDYSITSSERTATITFIDSGKKFNPLEEAKTPDINETDTTKRAVGGLGIFIIKKQADNLKYSYTNKTNNLTLTKKETIQSEDS